MEKEEEDHRELVKQSVEFIKWLEDETWKRRMTYSAVASAGGISHARVSQVLSGGNPGWEFSAAIARAFDKDLALVAHKAGLWERTPNQRTVEAREYVRLFEELPPQQRVLVLVQMRAWTLHAERERRRREEGSEG